MTRKQEALTEFQENQTVTNRSLWNMPPMPLVEELPVHWCLTASWIDNLVGTVFTIAILVSSLASSSNLESDTIVEGEMQVMTANFISRVVNRGSAALPLL